MDLNPFKPKTEADAWSQAPSLESLMRPLMEAMGSKKQEFVVCFGQSDENDGEWRAVLHHALLNKYSSRGVGATLSQAIAALFVIACEGGLIDPATVVLP